MNAQGLVALGANIVRAGMLVLFGGLAIICAVFAVFNAMPATWSEANVLSDLLLLAVCTFFFMQFLVTHAEFKPAVAATRVVIPAGVTGELIAVDGRVEAVLIPPGAML